MAGPIRIGNQTSVSCADPMRPFAFALEHGFDAFEWFADKKWDSAGHARGWEEPDIDATARAWIRQAGTSQDVLFTVHAPWQANPLHPDGIARILRSIDLARDIGAVLVNFHLYLDNGVAAYAQSLAPAIRYAAPLGLQLSIENTPETEPVHFNQVFAELREHTDAGDTVGMCLDIGHANLCAATHNDFIRYLDELSPEVPLLHMHVHENYGDRDSHLPLFTGPARHNDKGIRSLVQRIQARGYEGALVMEQWPDPPELLVEAATRLRGLLA
jgi:sugar phosphate isomerase/epimerase